MDLYHPQTKEVRYGGVCSCGYCTAKIAKLHKTRNYQVDEECPFCEQGKLKLYLTENSTNVAFCESCGFWDYTE